MSEWIDAEEYAPEDQEMVLVCDDISNVVSLARFYRYEDEIFKVMSLDDIEIDFVVTHWMKLPQCPTESRYPLPEIE